MKWKWQWHDRMLLVLPCLLAVAAALCIFIFQHQALRNAEEQTYQILHGSAQQQSKVLRSTLEGQYMALEVLGPELEWTGGEVTAALRRDLATARDGSLFLNLWLADADGNAVRHDGKRTNVAELDYFRAARAGERGAAYVESLYFPDEMLFLLSVPVERDGEIVGVLFGPIEEELLWQRMTTDEYGDHGYSFVCTSAGQVLIGTYKDTPEIRSDDALRQIAAGEITDDGVRELAQSLAAGESGRLTYTAGGIRRYAAYQPLGVADWSVIVVALDKAVDDLVTPVIRAGRFFVAALLLLTALICALIMLISRREQRRTQYELDHDALTGLFSRRSFMKRTARMLKNAAPGDYIMACLDVENFKVVNDQLGHAEGDRLLRHIATRLRGCFHKAKDYALCRDTADMFLIITRIDRTVDDTQGEQRLRNLVDFDLPIRVTARLGLYEIDDPAMEPSSIIDRAILAQRTVKGSATRHVAWYDESIRTRILRQQEIVGDMETALAEGQFEVWFQPQYDLVTGRLSGAEALVRWEHPKHGQVLPGDFIAVFEENGFITRLDAFVWEETCRLLHKWRAAGLCDIPISVNMSQIDVFDPGLCARLCGLIEKYRLEPSALHLEITESAYAEDPRRVINAVKELQAHGFFIEMDDFGKGYSSLNLLKDIPIDLLKLDMRFLGAAENMDDASRGGVILSSVLRMMRWLNIPVIAEGVETQLQANYLKTIGCTAGQGYLFAKPMPAADFEALLSTAEPGAPTQNMELADFFNSRGMWDPEALDTLIFNSIMGAAGIFECRGEQIEALRLNDRFYELLGFTRSAADTVTLRAHTLVVPEDWAILLNMLKAARGLGDEAEIEVRVQPPLQPGRTIWVNIHGRVIARSSNSFIIYATFEDRTGQKLAELREQAQNERARILIENTGMTVIDYDPKTDILELNGSDITGGSGMLTIQLPDYLSAGTSSNLLHPADAAAFRALIRGMLTPGGDNYLEYRVSRDGVHYRWCDIRCFALFGETGRVRRVIGLGHDIQEKHEREALIAELNERLRGKGTLSAYDPAIAETAFHLLHEAEDIDRAIQTILETLGQRYGVSRAYVFEDSPDHSACSNTYEWCAAGVAPQIDKLQGLSYDDDLCGIRALFDEHNIFFCPDVAVLPAPLRALLEPQQVRSLLLCAIMDNGVFSGYVGFDDCTGEMRWTEEQTGTLSLVSTIIATFLIKRNEHGRALFSSDFKTALEGNSSYIYIIDPESYEIIYSNKALREATGMNVVGELCYRVYRNRETPCEFCPVIKRREQGVGEPVEMLRPNGRWLLTQASPLRWQEREVYMLLCADITRQKQAEEALRVRGEEYAAVVRQSGKGIVRYNISADTAETCFDSDLNFGAERTVPGFLRWLTGGIIAEESLETCNAIFADMRAGVPEGGCNLLAHIPRRDCRWYHMDYALITGADGGAYAIISFYDNTEQREKELAYQKWQTSLKAMLADNTIYMEINLTRDRIEREENLRTPARSQDGRRLSDFVAYGSTHITYADDVPAFISFFDRERLLGLYYAGKTADTIEYRAVVGGRPQWFHVELQMVDDPFNGDVKAFVVYTNIDHALRERERLASAAERDSLTKLYNHATTKKLIKDVLAGKEAERCAFLILDLDNLSEINNTFGHPEGDRAIKAVADVMRAHFREGDILGRIGGDEFVALLRNVSGATTLRSTMASFMRRIAETRIGPQDDQTIHCSIGGAFGFTGRDSFETLYKQADRALY